MSRVWAILSKVEFPVCGMGGWVGGVVVLVGGWCGGDVGSFRQIMLSILVLIEMRIRIRTRL